MPCGFGNSSSCQDWKCFGATAIFELAGVSAVLSGLWWTLIARPSLLRRCLRRRCRVAGGMSGLWLGVLGGLPRAVAV